MPKNSKKPDRKHKKAQSKSEPANAKRRSLKARLRRAKPETPPAKVSGSFRLFADSLSLLRQHWKLFGGITLIYLILNIYIVGALKAGYDIVELKDTIVAEFDQLTASLAVFGLLLESAGNAGSESSAAYQTIVIFLVSLATIWALRQVLAGEKIGIRDAFYKGMYPLVPFLLVLLVIALQLIPFMAGAFIFASMFGSGLAVTVVEQVVWALVVFLLVLLSLYWLSSSVFALYVVTLPDVRPIAALRAARKLVRYRRWAMVRKLLFLPLALLTIGAVIVLPLIAVAPGIVQVVFLVLATFSLVFAHTYIYSLYKELL